MTLISTRTRKPFLPKTGQVTSYASYDDGAFEKGSPIAPRFVDNADGTVSDRVTNLMWAKDGSGVGCYSGGIRNWSEALTWAEGLNFAGHTDWRLPNVYELFSICLLEAGAITDVKTSGAPYINQTFFPNTVSSYYWSSTTYPNGTGYALGVYFSRGYVGGFGKTVSYYVRAVRAGQ